MIGQRVFKENTFDCGCGRLGSVSIWHRVPSVGTVLKGDMPLSHCDATNGGFLLGARKPMGLAVEQVPSAVNSALDQLRTRLGELPDDRVIYVICRSGQRAYTATRILQQNGYQARTLSGAFCPVPASELKLPRKVASKSQEATTDILLAALPLPKNAHE